MAYFAVSWGDVSVSAFFAVHAPSVRQILKSNRTVHLIRVLFPVFLFIAIYPFSAVFCHLYCIRFPGGVQRILHEKTAGQQKKAP